MLEKIMPKNYIIYLKTIWRSWFIFLVIVILITAIYYPIAAIILTIITIALFVLSFLPSLFFKNRLLRFLKKFYRIEETDIIKEFSKDKTKIRKGIFKLSQNQKKKDWLIVFLENHYIFYHKDIVEKFKELYKKKYGEKEIFDAMKKIDIKTRAEVKAIMDTLERNDRLIEEEITT